MLTPDARVQDAAERLGIDRQRAGRRPRRRRATAGILPRGAQAPGFVLAARVARRGFEGGCCHDVRSAAILSSTLHEQRGDRRLLVDAPDGLPEQPRDRQDVDLADSAPARRRAGWCWSRSACSIGDALDAIDRRRPTARRAPRRRCTRSAPLVLQRLRRLLIVPAVSMMSSCMMQVRPFDVADHVHHLGRAVSSCAACR